VLKGIPGGLKEPSRRAERGHKYVTPSVFASSLRKVNILNACLKSTIKEPHRNDFLI
jgi:hypothetical protein